MFLRTKADACCPNRLTLLCGFQKHPIGKLKGAAEPYYGLNCISNFFVGLTAKAFAYQSYKMKTYCSDK
jgi:hypothetical protein